MCPSTKQGEDRQTHDADGRLGENVRAVISSVTALADFPSPKLPPRTDLRSTTAPQADSHKCMSSQGT
ncbi:hypothetical protein CesoFtcFv8_008904 [Champsocephalus esox]|uniref:Uncharacterized protein n=1 Tax=Champsocephalus esox TaxID=159716 RepID=A0AAN8H2D3_9TELE|nr:hypothetical protein CesoFtcFv8_008904 [Champsocephalus esox]